MAEKFEGGVPPQEAEKSGHQVEILTKGEKDDAGTLSGKEHLRKPVTITEDQLKRIQDIVRELNVQAFGVDTDEGPTAQDWLDTVQYNLNHASPEKLGLSEDSIKFIEESGLFLN